MDCAHALSFEEQRMKRFVVASLVTGLSMVASAKPPEAPTLPETEFRVLSPLAAEFHQSETPASAVPFTPVAAAPIVPVGDAFTGIAGTLARRGLVEDDNFVAKVRLTLTGGVGSFFGEDFRIRLEAKTRHPLRGDRMARDVLEMADRHRDAGDWAEARRWYKGIQELFPDSPSAVIAANRLEREAMLRVLAEAGQEQSEEPPIAGPERLYTMPREVKPSR